MFTLVVFAFIALTSAASLTSINEVIEADTVDGYPLTSPWAVAYKNNKIYFSNFGAPGGSRDWVGTADADGSGAKKLYTIEDAEVEVMHIRAIAVDGSTVFMASYGGPTDSHILKCSSTSCQSIRTLDTEGAMITALAYSSSLGRLFYTAADGNLEASRIYSINLEGADRRVYVEQSEKTGLASPVGLAIDDERKHIYWTNAVGPDLIQRGNLADKAVEAEVGTLLPREDAKGYAPHALQLDTTGQFLYFTDISSSEHRIARIDLNGDNLETLASRDENTPHSLALDIANKKIYWAETGSSAIQVGTVNELGVEPSKTGTASTAALATATALVALVASF